MIASLYASMWLRLISEKRLIGLALAIEELQHDHAADVLLQVRINAGDGDADAAIGIAHPVAENLGRERR